MSLRWRLGHLQIWSHELALKITKMCTADNWRPADCCSEISIELKLLQTATLHFQVFYFEDLHAVTANEYLLNIS